MTGSAARDPNVPDANGNFPRAAEGRDDHTDRRLIVFHSTGSPTLAVTCAGKTFAASSETELFCCCRLDIDPGGRHPASMRRSRAFAL